MHMKDYNLSTDGANYIVTVAHKAYRINEPFYQVLCYTKAGWSLEYAINKVSTDKNIDVEVLTSKFNVFTNTIKSKSKGEGYIHFKQVIFKGHLTNLISAQLAWLFSTPTLIVLFLTCSMLNLFYFIDNGNTIRYQVQHNILFDIVVFIFYLLSLVIHEFGHAAGTKAVGQRAKEIGFGFYLIFPVFYTDVTSVWNLRKRDRIIVNIGGVYFQMIVNSIAIIYVLVFPHSIASECMRSLIFSNFLVIVISMTPFFRNDGYWILSDYWGIPNLLKKSDECLVKVFRNIKREEKEQRRLVLFGISNNVFRLYVLVQLMINVCVLAPKVVGNTSVSKQVGNIIIITISVVGIFWIVSIYRKLFTYARHRKNN